MHKLYVPYTDVYDRQAATQWISVSIPLIESCQTSAEQAKGCVDRPCLSCDLQANEHKCSKQHTGKPVASHRHLRCPVLIDCCSVDEIQSSMVMVGHVKCNPKFNLLIGAVLQHEQTASVEGLSVHAE